jgi:hypothetical protein
VLAGNEPLAFRAALFFCFGPASIFMSALYTEATFSTASLLFLSTCAYASCVPHRLSFLWFAGALTFLGLSLLFSSSTPAPATAELTTARPHTAASRVTVAGASARRASARSNSDSAPLPPSATAMDPITAEPAAEGVSWSSSVLAALCFALSCFARSNGVLYAGYFLYQFLRGHLHALRRNLCSLPLCLSHFGFDV